MKKLFEYANVYAGKSTWKEFALVKFCLCAIGVMIGVSLQEKAKKKALGLAGIVFALTYIPLMRGFFKVVRENL